MIEGENKILQAFLGTLLTYGLTAAGSALVFIFSGGRFHTHRRKILDFSLGFAAGVMTASSFWCLMTPAIKKAEGSGTYGGKGEFAFVPVTIGFLLGAAFVLLSECCLPKGTGEDPTIQLARLTSKTSTDEKSTIENVSETLLDKTDEGAEIMQPDGRYQKENPTSPSSQVVVEYSTDKDMEVAKCEQECEADKAKSWKRMLLLIIAITVHNIPEGLAVGVAFGAIGSSDEATFASARNLVIGVGIQNFPEGMAVSVPLCAAGYSPLKSFWYGQLSGLVEPIFGLLGALVVVAAKPLLSYALSFAAGAMIYVVMDDIIPEAHTCGNGKFASWGCMIGFLIMMILDVGLEKAL